MARGWIVLVSLAVIAFELAAGEVPAIFIFGDSTVDVGTNNFLNKSLARADNPYYGIDYPYSKPTGRFSNGLNTADFLARHLGGYKRSPPPFLYLINRMWSFKSDILHGVNFASGGSGIFNQTGNQTYVKVIPLREQIEQFATVCRNITEVLDQTAADDLLSKSLYIISVGSNDIFEYQADPIVSPKIFMANLQDSYAKHLEKLYHLGARKFGIISVPPIGCVPAARPFNKSGGCMEDMNGLAQAFYTSTQSLLQQFSTEFKGVKYSLGNTYQMVLSIILNSNAEGFKDIRTACCGDGETPCKSGSKLCPNRKDFLFWDRFHPTQTASDMAARTLVYSEAAELVTPMNFSKLAMA